MWHTNQLNLYVVLRQERKHKKMREKEKVIRNQQGIGNKVMHAVLWRIHEIWRAWQGWWGVGNVVNSRKSRAWRAPRNGKIWRDAVLSVTKWEGGGQSKKGHITNQCLLCLSDVCYRSILRSTEAQFVADDYTRRLDNGRWQCSQRINQVRGVLLRSLLWLDSLNRKIVFLFFR